MEILAITILTITTLSWLAKPLAKPLVKRYVRKSINENKRLIELGLFEVADLETINILCKKLSMEGIEMVFNSFLKPKWSLGTTLIVFVYSTAIASLASFFPSRKAAKIEPVEALRGV